MARKRSLGSPKETPAPKRRSARKPTAANVVEESPVVTDSTQEHEEFLVAEDEEVASGSIVELKLARANIEVPKSKANENAAGTCPDDEVPEPKFISDPVPDASARSRWPHRYAETGQKKKPVAGVPLNSDDESEETVLSKRHYTRAEVDGKDIYDLGDDAHVYAGEGEDPYICKIVEFFEGKDRQLYFTAQWYYRARDTEIKQLYTHIDEKRVFYSEIRNVNPLGSLVKKLKIARLPLTVESQEQMAGLTDHDYYCNMLYLVPFSTFVRLPQEDDETCSGSSSTISSENEEGFLNGGAENTSGPLICPKEPLKLLDLYSGCGAMSTGICLGAKVASVDLITKWAVDLNKYACESLRWNHPETQVRNEAAEDFLSLLKEWRTLCLHFGFIESIGTEKEQLNLFGSQDGEENDDGTEDDDSNGDEEIFEVEEVLDICFGDPKDIGNRGLYFKVHWKNYGLEHDTWEPFEGLSNCEERIGEFVARGYKDARLPLPGHVDVVCGGPPCQGISGFNRFRDRDDPLRDEKNKQLKVYMDIVEFLKPKFCLMENVVDLLRFSGGFLGRYALARLLKMNYQARIGIMAAGRYGLPQFRGRVFMWGACPTQSLPQYPLPTHEVVNRGVTPTEFGMNNVIHRQDVKLEKALLLKDAISDLPAVGNNELRDEMPYDKEPETDFQQSIRQRKIGPSAVVRKNQHLLYDHRPLALNQDDYDRVCQIPHQKGANFRDLKGVRVNADNKVEWDPEFERVYLKSGKPLVPDYAMSFIGGKSSKPFGRLWWDETVATVVTRAEPHNQVILHPEQDRVLTIRENARLQGFPDHYKLFGPIKERYIQVGNAVAVPVAKALGYAWGLALSGKATEEGPLLELPKGFIYSLEPIEPCSDSCEE